MGLGSWFKVNTSARITNASFNFEKKEWTVTGYLDFVEAKKRFSDHSNDHEFERKFHMVGEEYALLYEMLADRCGEDLQSQEDVWRALAEKQRNQ